VFGLIEVGFEWVVGGVVSLGGCEQDSQLTAYSSLEDVGVFSRVE